MLGQSLVVANYRYSATYLHTQIAILTTHIAILKIMKKILRIASKAVQVVLAAPVKLPAKVVQVVKYVALLIGIAETVIHEEKEDKDEIIK